MPLTALLVYTVIDFYKLSIPGAGTIWHRLIPILSLALGGIIGLGLYFLVPEIVMSPTTGSAIVKGAISGLGATGCNQVIKQFQKPD